MVKRSSINELNDAEKKNFFHKIVDLAADPILATDEEMNLVYINREGEIFFGYSPGELYGKHLNILIPDHFHESHEKNVRKFIDSNVTSRLMNDQVQLEVLGLKKDKSEFYAEISLIKIPLGSELFLVAIIRDISKSKEVENKLKVFAATVSHDLKAPLRHIENIGKFLEEDYAEFLDEKVKDRINQIEIMTARMTNMIDSALQFSQTATDVKPFKQVNLKELLQQVMDNLKARVEETSGTVNIGDLPSVFGDQYLMLQLFQNLIANALKFHQSGEPPIINVYGRPGSSRFYEIVVEDKGIGFDEKDADKIFLPFKRLVGKDKYEGSGIGLATCKKIVDHHKGTITCHSQRGKGSTFVVTLPKESL